jgi:hypothetical protein
VKQAVRARQIALSLGNVFRLALVLLVLAVCATPSHSTPNSSASPDIPVAPQTQEDIAASVRITSAITARLESVAVTASEVRLGVRFSATERDTFLSGAAEWVAFGSIQAGFGITARKFDLDMDYQASCPGADCGYVVFVYKEPSLLAGAAKHYSLIIRADEAVGMCIMGVCDPPYGTWFLDFALPPASPGR